MQPELIHEIKSRPEYSPIEKKENALMHLFIVAGETPEEITAIIERCEDSKTIVISADKLAQAVQGVDELIPSLPMATAVYIAGSESFLWGVAERLSDAGMASEQIQMLSPTVVGRAVFCCHCYSITPAVTQSPAQCDGCQRLLAVTDHFSKKHAAYMGYQINAEDPNDIPEAEELS